jgi:uncharacterized membrane protein
MGSPLATGVPMWPDVAHSSFDGLPLLLVAIALVLAPTLFGIRLTRVSVTCLIVGGTLAGWLGDSIGVFPAISIVLVGLAVASEWLRRRPTRSS